MSERYVSRAVCCAFLAPDLVEAALQWRQPAQLTLSLMENLPLDWNEQRRRFGLRPTHRPVLPSCQTVIRLTRSAEILEAAMVGRSAALKPHRSSNSACSNQAVQFEPSRSLATFASVEVPEDSPDKEDELGPLP